MIRKPVTFHSGRIPDDRRIPRARLNRAGTGLILPTQVNWLNKVSDWGVLGNDRYGDCCFAGAAHLSMALSSQSGSVRAFDTEEVLEFYSEVTGFNPLTGANDNGAMLRQVLHYWSKHVWNGVQPLMYAEVPVYNRNEVLASMQDFGGLYAGMQFPESAQEQFNAGEPWTVVPGAQIAGGHCIYIGAWHPGEYSCVTWGQVQPMTERFFNTYVDEVWAVLDPMDWLTKKVSPSGYDLEDLRRQVEILREEEQGGWFRQLGTWLRGALGLS